VSKYHNRQTAASDGTVLASQKEARRYEELLLLWKMGKITKPQTQVRYELIPAQAGERKVEYVADFVYSEMPIAKWPASHVEDTKGFRTEVYKIKRKLMLYVHGIRIEEI
jgi:hypothetical protein